MNSSAAIKAFVGEHGGAVCTSSNCRNVLEWAIEGDSGVGYRVSGFGQSDSSETATRNPKPETRTKILFFPDQHLGRNTAHAMGYPLDKMVVWDPREDLGGNNERDLATPTSSSGKATARCISSSGRSTSIRCAPNTRASR